MGWTWLSFGVTITIVAIEAVSAALGAMFVGHAGGAGDALVCATSVPRSDLETAHKCLQQFGLRHNSPSQRRSLPRFAAATACFAALRHGAGSEQKQAQRESGLLETRPVAPAKLRQPRMPMPLTTTSLLPNQKYVKAKGT